MSVYDTFLKRKINSKSPYCEVWSVIYFLNTKRMARGYNQTHYDVMFWWHYGYTKYLKVELWILGEKTNIHNKGVIGCCLWYLMTFITKLKKASYRLVIDTRIAWIDPWNVLSYDQWNCEENYATKKLSAHYMLQKWMVSSTLLWLGYHHNTESRQQSLQWHHTDSPKIK